MHNPVVDPADLSADTFAPYEGSTFVVTPSTGSPFEVTLAAVSRGHPGPPREQFSLLFVGGPTPPVPQGMAVLRHDELGTVELFLVALGPGPDGQRYEAAFS
jgi:hypothetical protein